MFKLHQMVYLIVKKGRIYYVTEGVVDNNPICSNYFSDNSYWIKPVRAKKGKWISEPAVARHSPACHKQLLRKASRLNTDVLNELMKIKDRITDVIVEQERLVNL